MNCDTGYSYANEEECFGVLEDPCGVLKKPTVNDQMFSVGPVDFGQEQEFLEDEQIRASASKLPSILGRLNPGDWSMATYIKPSGVLGTVPEHAVLYLCLMGDEDVQGSYVDYVLKSQLDSFSLWVKKGHTVFAFRGATVESGEFGISGDAIGSARFSGKHM